MKKWILCFCCLVLMMSSCTKSQPEQILDFTQFYGVWASKDIELVRTAKFSLIFYRIDDVITSVLYRTEVEGNFVTFNARAMAQFDNSDESIALKAKDLLEGEDVIIRHDDEILPDLNKRQCRLESSLDKLFIKSGKDTLEELDTKTRTLKIRLSDGLWHTLKLIENLEVTEPYDMRREVTKTNLGECIQLWQLGSSFWKDENGTFWAFHLGTNKHLYTFTMNKGFLYCRAARIRSNSNGSVFSQNIRLVGRGNALDTGFIGFMAEDNLAKAGTDVIIDDSKFDATCGIAYDVDIYWSLKSIEDNLIRLNGCDQEYVRTPAKLDSLLMLEWIVYVPYSE